MNTRDETERVRFMAVIKKICFALFVLFFLGGLEVSVSVASISANQTLHDANKSDSGVLGAEIFSEYSEETDLESVDEFTAVSNNFRVATIITQGFFIIDVSNPLISQERALSDQSRAPPRL